MPELILGRATQTREVDFMIEFFRRLKSAERTGDYPPVAEMVHPDAVLNTPAGEQKGVQPIIQHLRGMGEQRYRAEIVAPKGGLVAVLISRVSLEGASIRPAHEQTYRLSHDKLVELIDIGRTPNLVYRPESQPF